MVESDAALIESAAPVASRPRWADYLRDAILPVVAARVVLLLFGFLAVITLRPDAAIADGFLGVWNRWDAPHFLEVAANGYGPPSDPARIVLFPAFPALIATGSVVLPPLAAGMVVAFLASLAAAAGIYRLAVGDRDATVGRAAVLAMLVYPTAFALVAPYSESLFLAAVVWSFVEARDDEWRAAGALALIAGLTRIQGAFVAPALVIEYLVRHRRLRRDVGWLALGLGGPLIYLGINWATFGDPFRFVSIQRTVFTVYNVGPWDMVRGLANGLASTQLGEFWVTVYLAPTLAFIALLVASAWALVFRRSRPSYAVFALLNVASLATLSWPISVPRYAFGVFPILLAMADTVRRPWLATTVFVGSGLLLALCTSLYVIGHWAF
jgi:hypothetical protein